MVMATVMATTTTIKQQPTKCGSKRKGGETMATASATETAKATVGGGGGGDTAITATATAMAVMDAGSCCKSH